jgi:hypothetical protein
MLVENERNDPYPIDRLRASHFSTYPPLAHLAHPIHIATFHVDKHIDIARLVEFVPRHRPKQMNALFPLAGLSEQKT